MQSDESNPYKTLYELISHHLIQNPPINYDIVDKMIPENQKKKCYDIISRLQQSYENKLVNEMIDFAKLTNKYGMNCYFFDDQTHSPLQNLRNYSIEIFTKTLPKLFTSLDSINQNLLRLPASETFQRRQQNHKFNILKLAQNISNMVTKLTLANNKLPIRKRSLFIKQESNNNQVNEENNAKQKQIIQLLKNSNLQKDKKIQTDAGIQNKLMHDIKQLQEVNKQLENKNMQNNKNIELFSVKQFEYHRQIQQFRTINEDLHHKNTQNQMRIKTFEDKQNKFRLEVQQLHQINTELKQLEQTKSIINNQLTELHQSIVNETKKERQFLKAEIQQKTFNLQTELQIRQEIINELKKQKNENQQLLINNKSIIQHYQNQIYLLTQKIADQDLKLKEKYQQSVINKGIFVGSNNLSSLTKNNETIQSLEQNLQSQVFTQMPIVNEISLNMQEQNKKYSKIVSELQQKQTSIQVLQSQIQNKDNQILTLSVSLKNSEQTLKLREEQMKWMIQNNQNLKKQISKLQNQSKNKIQQLLLDIERKQTEIKDLKQINIDWQQKYHDNQAVYQAQINVNQQYYENLLLQQRQQLQNQFLNREKISNISESQLIHQRPLKDIQN